jgi:hypothetical protein
MGTDSTQHAGQGQVFHDDFQGLFIFALSDHLYVGLHVQTGRTGQSTGCRVTFLNGIRARDRLGISLIGGLFDRQPFVVFVGQINRADFGAFPAAGAFGKIDKTRLLTNPGLEPPGSTVQLQQFGIG